MELIRLPEKYREIQTVKINISNFFVPLPHLNQRPHDYRSNTGNWKWNIKKSMEETGKDWAEIVK